MLNKIRVIGEILSTTTNTEKQEEERTNDTGIELEKKIIDKSLAYFSLLVLNPSNSLTILRCEIRGEKAKKIGKEIGKGEVVEVKGYLRNEKFGFQIIIRVVEIDIKPRDTINVNQVQLLGRVFDFDFRENEEKSKSRLDVRISVPRDKNPLPSFFCNIRGELALEANSKLKNNDIVIFEGYLQTKKLVNGNNISRKSTVICQAFTLLDSDSASQFSSNLENFTRVFKEVEKIDFDKPKEKY
ncbi:single-stranded DNA-binding protein [endosymbiont GvMRE of Glomus versiforme]|uniref:single-stranded DNA-binding protein n=1 Tax=endosymbiont GvMRE of Glomus versiforme TaxID=2039283 RepID=UPI000EE6438F|nr:single-stranded DNA-binding protein [endosymbiont GvMRE of Glomus versiforme]RHZ35226.1 hypothetical protein GvMRE_IIg476 [endosymbiont GvMRE of Glomus versiforme]